VEQADRERHVRALTRALTGASLKERRKAVCFPSPIAAVCRFLDPEQVMVPLFDLMGDDAESVQRSATHVVHDLARRGRAPPSDATLAALVERVRGPLDRGRHLLHALALFAPLAPAACAAAATTLLRDLLLEEGALAGPAARTLRALAAAGGDIAAAVEALELWCACRDWVPGDDARFALTFQRLNAGVDPAVEVDPRVERPGVQVRVFHRRHYGRRDSGDPVDARCGACYGADVVRLYHAERDDEDAFLSDHVLWWLSEERCRSCGRYTVTEMA